MLPPDDLKIRPSRPSDLQAICEMVEGLASYHGDPSVLDLETLQIMTMGPRPWIDCIVATLSDEVVGYAALQRKLQLQKALRIMDITHLFVIPQLRGQGIGKALIDGACLEARLAGCGVLTVGTAPSNLRAAALYRSVGFEDQTASGPRFHMAL